MSGLLCYVFVILSILWTWHWTRWNTQSLVYYKSKNLNGLNDFDPFFLIVVFCSNSHRGRLNQFYQRRGRAFIIWGVYLRQTSHHLCAYFKINRFDELSSTKIRRLPRPNNLPRCAIHARCECRQFSCNFRYARNESWYYITIKCYCHSMSTFQIILFATFI